VIDREVHGFGRVGSSWLRTADLAEARLRRVLATALSAALDPGVELRAAADGLTRLARSDVYLLRQALRRVQAGLGTRPGPVGRRADRILALAIDAVLDRPRVSEAMRRTRPPS
jgi:hypothetical protein